MPTKPNSAGEQQDYVPAGNGDPSEIEGADLEIEQPKSGFSSFKQPKKE